ncbi:methyltransferase domain-containing protein [Streptomyces sp. NPDC087440]|uniref:methyltransferase domain-containing protein n=1 Tax=Streptomyces sp. NPDC087440 TaxID=3365790 RepID=UPI00382E1A05
MTPLPLQAEFRHPLLVQVYDAECPWGPDDTLFLALANETPHARVLDLGCGTGRVTLALAAAGHTVTGIDPAPAALAAARAKPGAEKVTWLTGTLPEVAADLPHTPFNIAIMTAHVAQFLLTDTEWAETLTLLKNALTPGGRLIFDSRDPADRRWERWNPTDSRHEITLPDGLRVTAWTEVTEVSGENVSFTHHYTSPTLPDLHSTATLRFRPEPTLRTSLAEAGFTVEQIYGGWHREPVGTSPDGEFVVVARVQDLSDGSCPAGLG